jgi:hypothetical protein
MYRAIKTPRDVRILMEHHVFAVWDFMCLLKSLQRSLTCVDQLWVPRGDAKTRRLINEIVTAEESDQLDGGCFSHFELYLEAMRQAGADTMPISYFIDEIKQGHLVQVALTNAGAPRGAHDFVLNTIDIVSMNRSHAIAAAFSIGREEVIPEMFIELVREISGVAPALNLLLTYLERHIQLDGEEHSKLAMRMLEELCGNDAEKWNESAVVAASSLQARLALWDSVLARLNE